MQLFISLALAWFLKRNRMPYLQDKCSFSLSPMQIKGTALKWKSIFGNWWLLMSRQASALQTDGAWVNMEELEFPLGDVGRELFLWVLSKALLSFGWEAKGNKLILPGSVIFENCCRKFHMRENLDQPGGLSYSILLVYQTGGVLSWVVKGSETELCLRCQHRAPDWPWTQRVPSVALVLSQWVREGGADFPPVSYSV